MKNCKFNLDRLEGMTLSELKKCVIVWFEEKILLKLRECAIGLLVIDFFIFIIMAIIIVRYSAQKTSDFINLCVAFGTIASAAGLIYFGDSTYKNQRVTEFYSFFLTLISQYDDMVNKSFYETRHYEKEVLKEIYDELNNNFPYLISDHKQVESKINNCIDYIFDKSKIKGYFILLYQILKYIDEYAPPDDKTTYTRLIRAKTPFPILFIAVLQSYNKKYDDKQYQNFINKYAFLEHLPLNNADWINHIYLTEGISNTTERAEVENKNKSLLYRIELFAKRAFTSSQDDKESYFPRSVWGESLYVEKNRENSQ